ncbi:hypothetical protein IE53DRAFT_49830 [Violaceomyces palustris]|uniref:Uncharacterized protein n=1 Tax=Violaceomyces palustris TaxID=1673888 RepID=A0ACD0P7Y0_9BASI|nr:hypothetical protein IE53DRAFT_49830 [Violaceomyces palustris]
MLSNSLTKVPVASVLVGLLLFLVQAQAVPSNPTSGGQDPSVKAPWLVRSAFHEDAGANFLELRDKVLDYDGLSSDILKRTATGPSHRVATGDECGGNSEITDGIDCARAYMRSLRMPRPHESTPHVPAKDAGGAFVYNAHILATDPKSYKAILGCEESRFVLEVSPKDPILKCEAPSGTDPAAFVTFCEPKNNRKPTDPIVVGHFQSLCEISKGELQRYGS